jgi:hypothetical protein
LKKFGALSTRTGHWKQTAIETPNNRNPEQENVMKILDCRRTDVTRKAHRREGSQDVFEP